MTCILVEVTRKGHGQVVMICSYDYFFSNLEIFIDSVISYRWFDRCVPLLCRQVQIKGNLLENESDSSIVAISAKSILVVTLTYL